MEKLLKKRFVRTLLIVYLLSYILHDFFFINFKNVFAAETAIGNTNLVAVIVDKDIYENAAIKNKIKSYATDYIQKKMTDTKAIILPINTKNFKAPDIVKMLENMYFDGIKDAPSKLAGVILIGDIPLPVVEYNNFIYPSIYPYVDFEDQQFIYNANEGFFKYNENPNGQAEIWHGVIKYDTPQQYEKFFTKLENYKVNPSTFIAPKIRYDDFMATKEYFLTDNITYYVNNFLFTEDVGYRRYSNTLLDIFKGEHNKVINTMTNDLTQATNITNTSAEDQAEGAADADAWANKIKGLMDNFNSIMGEMAPKKEGAQPPQEPTPPANPPSPKSATLMLKTMITEFLKPYDYLLGTKYLVRMRENIKTPDRRYQENASGDLIMNFDSHYNKTILNDSLAVGDSKIGLAPVLMEYNNKMEAALNKKIEDEKYYMMIPVLQEYNDRTDSEKKKRSVYENFYFGKKVKDIKKAEDFSIYRGTWDDIQSGGSISGISLASHAVTNFNPTNKGIGGSYKIFGQQIEANRGYNLRNTQKDVDLFEPREGSKRFKGSYYNGQMLVRARKLKNGSWKEKNNKKRMNKATNEEEKGTTEEGQEVINKNRGGATPLNLDDNGNLLFSFYKESWQPIYDIAGSYAISAKEDDAHSFKGATTYSSLIKTKVNNGSLAYIYPRALTEDGDTNDQSKPVLLDNGIPKIGSNRVFPGTKVIGKDENPVAFVQKEKGIGYNFFDVFDNNSIPGKGGTIIVNPAKESDYTYTYKLIDSRIKNISPTPEQINGNTTNKFGEGSPLKDLYTFIKEEVIAPKDDIESKSTFTGEMKKVKNNIDQINTNLLGITNFDVNTIPSSGTQITALANTRTNSINTTLENNIMTGIINITGSLKELNDFLISSKTEIEKPASGDTDNNPYLTGYEYTTSLSIGPIIEAINKYQDDNKSDPLFDPFNIRSLGKIEFLQSRITDIQTELQITKNTFDELKSNFDTFKTNYATTKGSTLFTHPWITSLQQKKTEINNKYLCETADPNVNPPCGCTDSHSPYLPLCNAITNLKNTLMDRLNILSGALLTINASGTSLYDYEKQKYEENIGLDVTLGLEPKRSLITITDTTGLTEQLQPFNKLGVGFGFHASNGILSEINYIGSTLIDPNTFIIIPDASAASYTSKKEGGMDMTTRDRPIDPIRNITFQGIGGGLVQFNYPNLYEVEIYKGDSVKITLKKPDEIVIAIKEYLIKKAKEYNVLLKAEEDKPRNSLGNTLLDIAYPLGNATNAKTPLRPYKLLDEDFFITGFTENTIISIAKLMYYQNITRQEREPKLTVTDDINATKDAFDINKKTSYIVNNYLTKDNYQGPLVTPSYSVNGYEVAFINSDGQDYIKAKPVPTAIQEITTINNVGANQIQLQQENTPEEESIASECKFDPSGSELIFNIKTAKSPWFDAVKCRAKETLKKPGEIKIDFKFAQGPVFDPAGYAELLTGVGSDWLGQFAPLGGGDAALNTDEANAKILENATVGDKVTLTAIQLYVEMKLTEGSGNDSTSRQLGTATNNKQIKIFSTRDLGTLDITIEATGSNCFGIQQGATSISNNLCSKEKLGFNPFSVPKEYSISNYKDKAGTTIVTASFCLPNTQQCIKKAVRIEILADPLDEAIISTPMGTSVIAGGQIPFTIQGEDRHKNLIGSTFPDVYTFVNTGDGQISDGSYAGPIVSFSDFKKSDFMYIAPKDIQDVNNDGVENKIVYFSGRDARTDKVVLQQETFRVYKGFLEKIEPITFSLTSGALPTIELILRNKDKDGPLLTQVTSPVFIASKENLIIPGEKVDGKFKKGNTFTIKGGKLTIYLEPSFKIGEDELQITIPGIDIVRVPVKINPGTAYKVEMNMENITVIPNQTIPVTIKTYDKRDNKINTPQTLSIKTIGALKVNNTDNLSFVTTGENNITLTTSEPGGESYIYASIAGLALDKQIPATQDILIQKSLLPTTGLNIMYLSLFGTDRGNQWGYFSDRKEYISQIMNASEKLLAVTTQLMDPSKLKETSVIITENGQIKNLGEKEITLKSVNNTLTIDIGEIGQVTIGNDFELESGTDELLNKKNTINYIPEETDSIIETNEVIGKKIIINKVLASRQEIMNLDAGSIGDGVTITLAEEKFGEYSLRDVMIGDKKAGQLIINRKKDMNLIDNMKAIINLTSTDYDFKEIFAEASTNGMKGIGFYIKSSSFAKEGYKSIQDTADSQLGLGFTNNFKNITYFGNGKSVGESTRPFGSHFLINFGDPLLTKDISKGINNVKIKNTEFDGSLGDPIFSDPTKTIFKTLPIDFNNDGLQDMIVAYKDGTIKIMKNYGGKQPYKNLQNLMTIADSIKEVIVGDGDGNGYPDIMVRTNSNKLKVYQNNKGIFDVDGYLACLNTSSASGAITNTPDDLSDINQLFFKDMDDDKKLDIVTNDSRNDIKIFYGGSTNGSANYLSTIKYTCDTQRREREKNNTQLIRSFSPIAMQNALIQDESLIHRKGLITPPEDIRPEEVETAPNPIGSGIDGISDSKPPRRDKDEEAAMQASGQQIMANATGEAAGFMDNLSNYINQGLAGFNRSVTSPVENLPGYEPGYTQEQILYIQTSYLTGGDSATVYKTFEDTDGDILEIGDTVKITTTIGALQNSTFSYLENIKTPKNSQILINEDGSMPSFTGSGLSGTIITRDLSDKYDFMIDNIQLKVGESVIFSYEFIYNGTPLTKIDIKDEEVTVQDKPYFSTLGIVNNKIVATPLTTSKAKDSLPDIIMYPTNACKKYKLIAFNTNLGDKKQYTDHFHDIQKKIDEDNAKAAKRTQENAAQATSNATQTTNLDDIQKIPGVSDVLESRTPASILGDGGGANINTQAIDQMTTQISSKIDTALGGLCAGFKVGGKNSCAGMPVPFNQAFLAPGNYHAFGCIKLPPLDAAIGAGVPIVAFPTPSIIPIWPPSPGSAGGVFGAGASQVRLYLVPTLTLGLGVAICVGPEQLGKVLPKPFRDIGGNCVVVAIPPLTVCKDTSDNGGDSTQIEPATRETSKVGACTSTSKAGNQITFNNISSKTVASPFAVNYGSFLGGQIDAQSPDPRGGSFFGLGLDYKPAKISELPIRGDATTPAGGPSGLGNTRFNFGNGEVFELKQGDKINLKILGGMTKGLMKCIVKDRLDKQIMYLLNNLTKLTINITFPEISQLGQGRDKINFDTLGQILKSENKKDVKPISFSSTTTGASVKDKLKNLAGNAKKSEQIFQNISNITSNPFDAIMLLFKEVPLININTQNINVKVPMLSPAELGAYTSYLQARLKINNDILIQWVELVNNILGFCASDNPTERKTLVSDIKNLPANAKKVALKIPEQLKEEGVLKQKQLALKAKELNGTLTASEEVELKNSNTEYKKAMQCADFSAGLGKFLKFTTDVPVLLNSIRENIKTLQIYKQFPLKIYEWLHVVDRYLGEISSISANFVGSIMYWLNTNADRFSKYVDAIILIMGVIKTRQILIDFSANRSKKCSKCTNDDYSQQSCSLSFLCPKIPVLKIPNFKIPSLFIDLSHINLGLGITLPNFNFTPITLTLPKIPNLPTPPRLETFLDFTFGIDLDLKLFKNIKIPTIPLLPRPPVLPELPSFIPNIKITLPTLPPAPRIPKISSSIELSINIAEFIAKLYCIIKGGIGLVGEKGVKGKVEQITQRTWHAPIFDDFDQTLMLREQPAKGFDLKLDAYVNLKMNFKSFYDRLNAVVQPINNISNTVQGVAQENITDFEDNLNNNDITNTLNQVENLNVNDFQSYVPNGTTDYAEASTDLKKGLDFFKSKAKEADAPNTIDTIDKIFAQVNTKTDIHPAYKEIESVSRQVNSIIETKQKETRELADQIKNNYDTFIKGVSKENVALVKAETNVTTFSAPLFKSNEETKKLILAQENPNKSFLDINKKVVNGYIQALDQSTASELNMSQGTYDASKQYLANVNKDIDKVYPTLAYNEPTSKPVGDLPKAPTTLLAQSTPPCPTCGGGTSAGAGGTTATYSPDLSQLIKGIFIETIDGSGEKTMANVVRSNEMIDKIRDNYYMFDINQDKKDDIIMRDDNNIYIKYSSGDNFYKTNDHPTEFHYSDTYEVNIPDSPEKLRDKTKDDDGYITITEGIDFELKLADQSREVKNFKMQGQDFESIKFGRTNSTSMGDKPKGYIIRINQRVDTFNDKTKSPFYGDLEDNPTNLKYILILPNETNTGLNLTIREDSNIQDKSLSDLLTGTVSEIKFYDPEAETIGITLTEIPRARQYAQIATLTGNEKNLSMSSTRSNQIVAGRQLIADSKGPVGEFTLYRPHIDQVIYTGEDMQGFVSTNYEIKANWKDNIAVQNMWIEKDGEILKIITGGVNETGFISLPGLFFTGESSQNFFFGAEDFNGNISRTPVILKIKIPDLSIKEVNKNGDGASIIAEISNDLDEGNIIFQRERNNKRSILTGIKGTNSISQFPLTGLQTIITGEIFSIGNTIGFYNIGEEEIGTLNPKNGEILIHNQYSGSTEIKLDLSSHTPLVKIIDKTTRNSLFQVNLPIASLAKSSEIKNPAKYKVTTLTGSNFGTFNGGSSISEDGKPIIYIGLQGQIYIPTPYHSSLQGKYDFKNDTIEYHIYESTTTQEIAIIYLKFKDQTE